jgi:chromosome segregation ATPase
VTAEGNETSGGEPGRGGQPGGFGSEARRGEGDLFSERRARRAAESGELALARRAEAAEATVQTLERHVSSLQQRLQEAEQERLRVSELLEAEKRAALAREHELRLVKQREYAEQQLRVEAEERVVGLSREGRAEGERLAQRLSVSEAEAHELGARLEEFQRQLAEAEQGAAAGRAELRRAERDLQVRLDELERRAAQMQRGLDAERAARERTEAQLEAMSRGHRQMQVLLGETKAIVERLTDALAAVEARGAPAVADAGELAGQARGAEMADALAAAVERLRARAEVAAPAARDAVARPPAPPSHKHSLSLIGRWRFRRKQRRSR